VLQLCLIVLTSFSIMLAPISRYKGMIFGAQPPTVNFRVKMVSINWISIVLNCAAAIFHCTRLLSEILVFSSSIIRLGSMTEVRLPSPPPPIANFGLETVLNNWVSIVLNCAAAIFDRTRLLSEIWASPFNLFTRGQ